MYATTEPSKLWKPLSGVVTSSMGVAPGAKKSTIEGCQPELETSRSEICTISSISPLVPATPLCASEDITVEGSCDELSKRTPPSPSKVIEFELEPSNRTEDPSGDFKVEIGASEGTEVGVDVGLNVILLGALEGIDVGADVGAAMLSRNCYG